MVFFFDIIENKFWGQGVDGGTLDLHSKGRGSIPRGSTNKGKRKYNGPRIYPNSVCVYDTG